MKRTIILIAMIAVSLVAVASADPTMSVSQQPVDVGLNDTFTAEVTVDPEGGEIYGASYDLYFDVTILEAVEQTQGDFLSHGGVETIEYVNEINNTRGKITYVETRTGNVGGATEPGLLASITFKVIGTGISDLTLADVQFVDLAEPTPTPSQEPFQIYGRVCYDNGSSCSTLAVSITNLNTSEKWDVDTSDSYYQITLTSGIDLNATEVLRFNATDGMNINVTDHTVTADDVNTGGLFNFNLTISTVKIGDVNGDGDITSADAAIALRMAVSGEYSKMADVNGDNYVTSLDALMIQQAAVDHITL